MIEAEPGRAITPSPELKRPERLSDEQMDDLLAAFGNHEAKALTLIAMGSGSVFSRGNLHRAIINAQGQEQGWIMNHSGPFNYCQNSLSPIGLVTKEVLNEDLSTYGYQITNFGKETGIPLAGLLLDFSQRHNIPLYKIFAKTGSSAKLNSENAESETAKKRAPGTTRKILYELITSPALPIRQSDLEANIREAADVLQGHLERLNEAGLIGYQSTGVNQPFTYYQIKPNIVPDLPLPVYQRHHTLSSNVFAILKSNPGKFLTSLDVSDSLPEEITKTWVDKTELRSRISTILKSLEKEGWASIDKFQQGVQSEINLSDGQRAIISELVEILDRFQDQDPEILEEGKRLAGKIWTDPEKVSSLMLRAQNASGYANRWDNAETTAAILAIIQAYPEGISNQQIRETLGEIYDKRLGSQRIMQVTATLTTGKTIIVQTRGSVQTFFPAPVPQN